MSDQKAVEVPEPRPEDKRACLAVTPGICGFTCKVQAQMCEGKSVSILITQSECKQIQRLSESLTKMGLRELFMPVTRNPVFVLAQKTGCHASCPVPLAVLKAVEVAMEMALPRDVEIRFET
jgi:hypothetical protein